MCVEWGILSSSNRIVLFIIQFYKIIIITINATIYLKFRLERNIYYYYANNKNKRIYYFSTEKPFSFAEGIKKYSIVDNSSGRQREGSGEKMFGKKRGASKRIWTKSYIHVSLAQELAESITFSVTLEFSMPIKQTCIEFSNEGQAQRSRFLLIEAVEPGSLRGPPPPHTTFTTFASTWSNSAN